MKKIKSFIVFILILCLSGCNQNITSGLNLNTNGEKVSGILYLIGYNFENENPLLVKNEVNREIFSLIYDGLFTLDDKLRPVPEIANKITMKSDFLTYEVEIKDNITFHDGTKLTANDVVSTIMYLKNNNTFYDNNVKEIDSAKSSGNTVILSLNRKSQNLSSLLTFPIVPAKEILKGFNFNGSGRFKVSNYLKRKNMYMEPNTNYYKDNNIEIKAISIQLVPDRETANYSYSSGLSDIFSQNIFEKNDNVQIKANKAPIEFLSNDYTFLLLNNNMPVFSDKKVRQAINIAVNRSEIVSDILFSHAVEVSNPVSPASYLYEKNDIIYDVEKAKSLLLESGFKPDIDTGIMEKETEEEKIRLSFNILVNNDNNFRIQVANAVSENLKYVGIEANVYVVSFEEYKKHYNERTYEAFLGTVPMSFDFDLSMFMGENNVSNYMELHAVTLMNNIAESEGEKDKKEYFKSLIRLFDETVPHISLYYTKMSLYSSGKIKKGLNPTGFNILNNIENWSFVE